MYLFSKICYLIELFVEEFAQYVAVLFIRLIRMSGNKVSGPTQTLLFSISVIGCDGHDVLAKCFPGCRCYGSKYRLVLITSVLRHLMQRLIGNS